jgi:hypothetical protein
VLKRFTQTLVFVLPDWPGRRQAAGRRVSLQFAAGGYQGCYLRFYELLIGEMPEDLFRALVAHELAHVFCIASGEESHKVPHDAAPDKLAEAEAKSESIVRTLTMQWEFDHDRMEKWLDDFGLEEEQG